MMCRTCHKCRQFVKIQDESFEGTQKVHKFELAHSGHPVGIADLSELGDYENVSNKF